MSDCPIPQPAGGAVTLGGAYDLAVARGEALRQCNETRLAPLREWAGNKGSTVDNYEE